MQKRTEWFRGEQMTTKQYLNQIKRFDILIENKASEIEQLRSMATSITVATDGDRVQTSGDKDRVGRAVAKILDKENELEDLIEQYYDQKELILSQIETLDTSLYQILFYKYVNGYTIEVMSGKMFYSMNHIKRLTNKALDTFEEKYGETYLHQPYAIRISDIEEL